MIPFKGGFRGWRGPTGHPLSISGCSVAKTLGLGIWNQPLLDLQMYAIYICIMQSINVTKMVKKWVTMVILRVGKQILRLYLFKKWPSPGINLVSAPDVPFDYI